MRKQMLLLPLSPSRLGLWSPNKKRGVRTDAGRTRALIPKRVGCIVLRHDVSTSPPNPQTAAIWHGVCVMLPCSRAMYGKRCAQRLSPPGHAQCRQVPQSWQSGPQKGCAC